MPKYVDTEQAISGEAKNNSPLKLDNLDKLDKILDKGMGIMDKIIGMKKYKEQQGETIRPQAQVIQSKAEKVISNAPAPKIVIDDDKAVELVLKLLDSVPEDTKEKKIKELLDELKQKENQAFIKPQLNSFISNCVRLE